MNLFKSLFKSSEQRKIDKLIKKARGNLIVRAGYFRVGGCISSGRPGVVKFYKNLVVFGDNMIPAYKILRINVISREEQDEVDIWITLANHKEFFFIVPCFKPDERAEELNWQLALVRVIPMIEKELMLEQELKHATKVDGSDDIDFSNSTLNNDVGVLLQIFGQELEI